MDEQFIGDESDLEKTVVSEDIPIEELDVIASVSEMKSKEENGEYNLKVINNDTFKSISWIDSILL